MTTRAKRRRKTVEDITFSLLGATSKGLKVSYIAKTIDSTTRWRCSENTLGQIMKPHIYSGRIVSSLTIQGHSFWKLDDAYILSLETAEHGMET